MSKTKKTLVAFSTSWGTKFGGVNSFNHDLLCGFAGIAFNEADTVCVVLQASPDEIQNAAGEQIKLVQVKSDQGAPFSPDMEPAAWAAMCAAGVEVNGEDTVWLGHDRITGAVALAAARRRGGQSALIHHMSYSSYEAFAETSVLAKQKEEEQRQLFKSADIVLAVGPLLRDALADMLDRETVRMLVPGVPEIAVRRAPKTFKAFLSGRLTDDAKKIKQAHLGVAAFGNAIRQADENSLLPDVLRGSREPRLVLRGVDFEGDGIAVGNSAEIELKQFAEEYAGRAFPLHALPFTTHRETLFSDLSSASVAMMPSWHEGFGLVAWEAIGAGVPLILSKKSGVYRLLSELDYGMYLSLVMPIDVGGSSVAPYFLESDRATLTQAIIEIAKDSPEWKNKAARLREELAKRYSWAESGKQLIEAFQWTIDPRMAAVESRNGPATSVSERGPSLFELLETPVSIWAPTSGLSESQLLRAEEAVIPFHPNRDPFLDEQIAWAQESHFPISVRLLTGPGGVGKTRLALQFSERLKADGWVAGFLRGDCDGRQAADLAKKLGELDQSSLVVIDYAETRQTVLLLFLAALLRAQPKRPVRVMLLARDGGEWWNLLPSRDSFCEPLLEGMASTGPFPVPELHQKDLDRQAAYQLALQKFSEKLQVSRPEHSPQLDESHFAYPLYIQMAALIALRGERPKSAEALTRALVGHERRYWRKALAELRMDAQLIEDQAALLMTLSTLANGLATSREIEKVWENCGGDREILKPLFKSLAPLYPGRQGLDGWRPDLLGEALIAQVLLTEAGPSLLSAALGQNNQRLRQSSLTTLARLLVNRSDLGQIVEDALVINFANCAADLVSVCIETPSILPEIVERAFLRLRKQEQWQATGILAPHLQFEVLPLTGLDVLVSKVLMEKAERALNKATLSVRSDYARALSDLSVALNRHGSVREAWEVARAALDICRALAKAKPELYEPGLASALNLYATYSYALEKMDVALTAGKEALDIHSTLANAWPKEFEPELAHSLTNYAGVLSAQARNDDAFKFSQQAVELLERLFKTDPVRFEVAYTNAVSNHANRLQDQGKSDAALELIERVVEVGRKLASAKPERHEYALGSVLNNYATFLLNQGKAQQAIQVAEEALTIRRRLAGAKPARFESDYALSLSNYAAHLAQQGRADEAITVDEQALEIRQRLAHAEPVLFESDLSTSYSNYGVHLAEKGRTDEAIHADRQALSIRERFAEENPERYEPDLADSLSNLAEHMAHKGVWHDSCLLEERALSIYRGCASRAPHLYVFKRERSMLALRKWEWLKDRKVQSLDYGNEQISEFVNPRDMLALTFERACMTVYIRHDPSALESAVASWSRLDPVRQHALKEYYLTLGALGEHLLGSDRGFESWRNQWTEFYRQTEGHIPCWMTEILIRAGCDFKFP